MEIQRFVYLCFAWLLFANIYSSISGQTIFQNQLTYADSLFEQGNYFDAVTEYKRLLFFNSSGKYEYTANYKIAMCYKSGGKLDEAIKYFTLSVLSSKNKVIYSNQNFKLYGAIFCEKQQRTLSFY